MFGGTRTQRSLQNHVPLVQQLSSQQQTLLFHHGNGQEAHGNAYILISLDLFWIRTISLVTDHSKWAEVVEMSRTITTQKSTLCHLFAIHKLPEQVISDSRPQLYLKLTSGV